MEISEKSAEEIDEEIELEAARKIEAVLFIAGRYMSVQELVALTDVNPILLKKKLEDLKDRYKNCGVEISETNGLWKMDVSANYVGLVNKLASGSSEFTKAEQETLAIIAYKQPMKQSILVKIRGNKAYDHVKKFAELGLITKKRLGHTWELSLSESFHDYFHVNEEEEAESDRQITESNEQKAESSEGSGG